MTRRESLPLEIPISINGMRHAGRQPRPTCVGGPSTNAADRLTRAWRPCVACQRGHIHDRGVQSPRHIRRLPRSPGSSLPGPKDCEGFLDGGSGSRPGRGRPGGRSVVVSQQTFRSPGAPPAVAGIHRDGGGHHLRSERNSRLQPQRARRGCRRDSVDWQSSLVGGRHRPCPGARCRILLAPGRPVLGWFAASRPPTWDRHTGLANGVFPWPTYRYPANALRPLSETSPRAA
jgi:hypothetical protein